MNNTNKINIEIMAKKLGKKTSEEIQSLENYEVDFGFKDADIVTIVATKDSKHLLEGQEFNVSGDVAKNLIIKGLVKLK